MTSKFMVMCYTQNLLSKRFWNDNLKNGTPIISDMTWRPLTHKDAIVEEVGDWILWQNARLDSSCNTGTQSLIGTLCLNYVFFPNGKSTLGSAHIFTSTESTFSSVSAELSAHKKVFDRSTMSFNFWAWARVTTHVLNTLGNSSCKASSCTSGTSITSGKQKTLLPARSFPSMSATPLTGNSARTANLTSPE